jgi:RNA polymerase sigma factor for flagellar operon FliA
MEKPIERYEKWFYIRTRYGDPLRVIYVPKDMVEDTVFLSGDGLEERIIKKDLLFKARLCLNERYWEIIRLYYLKRLTMKQIGKRMSVTESRISQLHARAIECLRKRFGELH